MANRVVIADVDKIFTDRDITLVADATLTILITSAHNLINATIDSVYVSGLPATLSEDELLEIERWLSAHFAATIDRKVSSEGAGPVSQSYFGRSGKGLDFTYYGQMVKILDRTGRLAALGEKRRAATITTINPEETGGTHT